jgi:urease accessory protein
VICDRVLGHVDDEIFSRDPRERDPVLLTWQECGRRFLRKVSEGGRAVGLLLPVGPPMRHGDVLWADERVVIHVSVIEAAVLEIPTPTPRVAAGVAYELGAMHCAVELGEGAIYVAADDAMEAILGRMWIRFGHGVRRFTPHEPGLRVTVAEDFRVGDGE